MKMIYSTRPEFKKFKGIIKAFIMDEKENNKIDLQHEFIEKDSHYILVVYYGEDYRSFFISKKINVEDLRDLTNTVFFELEIMINGFYKDR